MRNSDKYSAKPCLHFWSVWGVGRFLLVMIAVLFIWSTLNNEIRTYIYKSPFVFTILFVLTLASDMAVLYGNDAFLIFGLSTKKRYSSFLKLVSDLQKICFKVKVLKSFKVFTDCHIKTCRSLKRRAVLKIPSNCFLEESMLYLLALK